MNRTMKTQKLNDTLIAEAVLQENEILSEKIITALKCDHDEVTRALREVLRFLFLVANHHGGMLTPSHRVDLAWHEFILCTKAYRDICDKLFGRYIDHHPGGPQEVNRHQYRETLRCYECEFGSPNPNYWGGDSELACGACETI
jgi:hypothetical protein